MGGHKDTRKSFSQVQDDLRHELFSNALSFLAGYGVRMNENSSLEDVLRRIAHEQFKKSYDYIYSNDGSEISPPCSIGDNRPIDKMCNIVTPIRNQVTDYLKAGVFSKLDLPRWMEQQAIAELCGKANDLVREDTRTEWRCADYKRVFDAKIEDTDSFVCTSVLVYTNGSLTEDGITASACIIYYMGVYYKTESPTTGLRLDLQEEAYTSSTKLILGLSTPSHDNELESNLALYSQVKFREYFGFDFDCNPPDSCRADGVGAAFMTHNKQLCYLPNIDMDGEISHYIDQHIFSGLNMSLPSVKRAALKNTVTEFKNAMCSASSDRWVHHRLEKTYQPANPAAHPVCEKGILMAWHASERARDGNMVSVTYVFIMTMFYETLPVEERAVKRLFEVLCNNLWTRLNKEGAFLTATADEITLQDMLIEYAKGQFKQGFGFEYTGDQSTPPDQHSNKVRGFAELFHTQKHPPPDQDVESWLNAEVFEKDSLTFPEFANNVIWEGLRDTAIECIVDSCSKDDWWYHTRVQCVYENPAGPVNIKQYGIYVYACGELEYEGVQIHRTFVCYLGVFCGVTAST